MRPTRATGGPYPEGEDWTDYHCTECGAWWEDDCGCDEEEEAATAEEMERFAEDIEVEQRSLLTAEFDDAEAAYARDLAEERAWEWEARETTDVER